MKASLIGLWMTALVTAPVVVSGYAFVPNTSFHRTYSQKSSSTSLQMVDSQVLMGAGVAVAGLVAGIGLVAFTESQGERAKERGGGLSQDMTTKIAGMLLEDVEVSSVSDIGSLTSKLESALKQSGGISEENMKQLELTEEEKKKIAEDADDGW